MSNLFGQYSPVVPSNTTWQEQITFVDEDTKEPVDLTGLDVRSQIRTANPVAAAGVPTTDPLLELTTPDYYGTPPEWPVYEGWSIPDPTSGTMILVVPRDTFLPVLNPTNVKVKYVWDVVLVGADGTIQPIISGKPLFLPGTTF
jgi:hypothetical protein